MKRLVQLFACLVVVAFSASAQVNTNRVRYVLVSPSGACGAGTLQYNSADGTLWGCENGTWAEISGGGSVTFATDAECAAGVITNEACPPSGVATAIAGSLAQSTVTWVDADAFTVGAGMWHSGQTTYNLTSAMSFQNTGWKITSLSGDNPVTLTLDTTTPPTGRAIGTNVWIDVNDDLYIDGITGTNCTSANGLQRVVSKTSTNQIAIDVDLPGACTAGLTNATVGVAPSGPSGEIVVSGWETGVVRVSLDAAIGQKMCYYTVSGTCSLAVANYAIVQLPDVDDGGYGVDPRAVLTVTSGDISSTITALRTPYGSPNISFGNGLTATNNGDGTSVAINNTVCLADGSNCSTGGNAFISFTGPATSTKTFTLPNATSTILTTNAAVTETQGGTGFTTYTTGDLLYASASNDLSKLAVGTTGQTIRVAGGVPAWGTLAEAGGGTNQTTYTTGDLLYASASNTLSKLGIGSTGQVLSVSGGIPAWSAASGGYDPFTSTVLGPVVEDFISGAVPTNTSLAAIGTSLVTYCNFSCGTFGYNSVTEAAHPGVVTMTTANVTDYEVDVTTGRGGTSYPQLIGPATLVGPKIMCIFKTDSSISTQNIFCGASYTGAFGANRIGIEYDTSASDTNWMCVSGDSDSSTRTSTGTSVATSTWYTATLEFTSTANFKCTVNSNNVTINPVAGNITSLNLNAMFGIRTRTGGQAIVNLDKFVYGGTATGR